MSYKLFPDRVPRGRGLHRDGWPAVFDALKAREDPDGILLDDFIEQTFRPGQISYFHKEPWVGIFHHPLDNLFNPMAGSRRIIEGFDFKDSVEKDSVKNLRAVITLSQHLADQLKGLIDVPIYVVKYPSPEILPNQFWDLCEFNARPFKMLAQVGWYLRNTQAIFQVPRLQDWAYVRYWPDIRWITGWDDSCAAKWYRDGSRPRYPGVLEYPLVSAPEYDSILANSIIMNEIIEASGNTVTVECIARNTPLIINRYPSVVEYLGPHYPLYFDNIQEVPKLLELERIEAAHRYLAAMEKPWIKMDYFIDRVSEICERHRK